MREIRTAILDCLERADGGKGFKAALEERGFILANGDRRDCFVVIDQAGGHHALNKKLTGLTLAAMRDRMADLDRSQLPSVDQAKEMQAERQGRRPNCSKPDRAGKGTLRPRDGATTFWTKPAGGPKRNATSVPAAIASPNRQRRTTIAMPTTGPGKIASPMRRLPAPRKPASRASRAGEGSKDRANRARPLRGSGAAGTGNRKTGRPLGRTAGDIRMAWQTSRSVSELEEALAGRGISLAEVSAEEARASQRSAAFAKEVGNFARQLKEGEIVAVNATRRYLSPRSAHDRRRWRRRSRRAWPASIASACSSVAGHEGGDARSGAHVLRPTKRGNGADMNTPLSAIEQVIADALTTTMTGHEFAAALDKAGITIARADVADIAALDALRNEADWRGSRRIPMKRTSMRP